MDQAELTSVFCARPEGFGWFLGAGASRSVGLPTATDLLWDLKRRHYCRQENQDVSRQDIQNESVRRRIQAYMESHGFPPEGTEDEYTGYFERIFGTDRELQRRYISAMLAEDKITLSVGSRALGAFIAGGLTRIAFTTNFDTVVEKAVADVGGKSLAAFHLEGPTAANQALNNEEFPIYCKLHGDFRYDSIKNLSTDLAAQNAALAQCFVNAGNRFGFIAAGYSGRDKSVMALVHEVLNSHNPFPNGLFWTGIKGSPIPAVVTELLAAAKAKGVTAAYVPIETYDALLLRLWRNTERKPPALDQKVRKSRIIDVNIPVPQPGKQKPLLRLNALPIASLPPRCLALTFRRPIEWAELREVEKASRGEMCLSKGGDKIYAWGRRENILAAFGKDSPQIEATPFPQEFDRAADLHYKSMAEAALCQAMARGKPLVTRKKHHTYFLIADTYAPEKSLLAPLSRLIGGSFGSVPDLLTGATEEFPTPEPVRWSEALRVAIETKSGKSWLLVEPYIWIWPTRARELASDFLDKRTSSRLNAQYNALLDTWITIVIGNAGRNAEVSLTLFDNGDPAENPPFVIGTRTGFSRKLRT